MTQRTIQLADAIVAELLGKTFGGFTLTGDSAPARRSHVLRDLTEAGSQVRPLVVSVVPRGKEKSRGARTVFEENQTVAVVLQRKLNPDSESLAQVDELAQLVERVDDHLSEVTDVLGDAVYDTSTTNPFWSVDDLLGRTQFTAIIEVEYDSDHEKGEFAAWSPADLSNLVALYDARQIAGADDGDDLPIWLDTSGNGHHLVRGLNGVSPVYQAEGISGLPALTSQGGAGRGNYQTLDTAGLSLPLHIVAVGQLDGGNLGHSNLWGWSDLPRVNVQNSGNRTQLLNDSPLNVVAQPAVGTPYRIEALLRPSPAQSTLTVKGGAIDAQASGATGASDPAGHLCVLSFQAAHHSNLFHGAVGFLCVVQGEIPADELEELRDNLAGYID